MNIISLPDLHGNHTAIHSIGRELAAADLILLPGDISSGTIAQAEKILDSIHCYNTNIRAVHGNWDDFDVEDYLIETGISLHGRCEVIDGVGFLGLGSVTEPGKVEPYFQHFIDQAMEGVAIGLPLVFVTHQPPHHTRADTSWTGLHLGSMTIRAFIETNQPLACLCGHVHERPGIENLGKTLILNPGPLWSGAFGFISIEQGELKQAEIIRVSKS